MRRITSGGLQRLHHDRFHFIVADPLRRTAARLVEQARPLIIATGIDWHCIPTDEGVVTYEAGEGAGTLLDREAAWRIEHHV